MCICAYVWLGLYTHIGEKYGLKYTRLLTLVLGAYPWVEKIEGENDCNNLNKTMYMMALMHLYTIMYLGYKKMMI